MNSNQDRRRDGANFRERRQDRNRQKPPKTEKGKREGQRKDSEAEGKEGAFPSKMVGNFKYSDTRPLFTQDLSGLGREAQIKHQ